MKLTRVDSPERVSIQLHIFLLSAKQAVYRPPGARDRPPPPKLHEYELPSNMKLQQQGMISTVSLASCSYMFLMDTYLFNYSFLGFAEDSNKIE